MNKLDPLHYLPVFLKPVVGRLVVFNPLYAQCWKENAEFLELLKLTPLSTPYLNPLYFEKLKEEPSDSILSMEKNLLSLAVQSLSLPEKLSEQEYYALMPGNYLSVTEKFLSRHVCGHVASSRHVLLKSLQIKGVGRTASTQQLSYPNMNGFVQTGEAIRGYFNGLLLKSSLPYGSVTIQAIISVNDEKLHSSLVLRDIASHRLAQIEPVFLSMKDKQVLKEELQSFQMTLAKIFEQHICLWVMGVQHPSTVDNLGLSGHPLDEEDMRPKHSMNGLTFEFRIHHQFQGELKEWRDLEKIDFAAESEIHQRFTNILKWYDEALSWINDSSSEFESFQMKKMSILKETLLRFFEEQDVESFLQAYTGIESKGFQSIKKDLCEISLTDSQMQLRLTKLQVFYQLKMKNDLRGAFNQLPRTSIEKIIQKMGQFEMDDHSKESDTAIYNSSQMHKLSNRQSFSLGREAMVDRDYLLSLAGGYEIHSLIIFTLEGQKEVRLEELADQSEFVLVDLNILFRNGIFALPVPKFVMRYQKARL